METTAQHDPPPPTSIQLLTTEEAARILRCTEPHVRKLVHLGLLEASRIGCGLRIRPAAIEALIDAHRAEGPDPRRDPRRHGKIPTGRPPRAKGRRG